MPAQKFLSAHAGHPHWKAALDQCIAHLQGQIAAQAAPRDFSLGFCYLTDYFAAAADDIVGELRARLPDVEWVGTVGIGVSASGVEHFDEPAISLLLTDLPRADFRIFSGRRPMGRDSDFDAHTALVHSEGSTPDLQELLVELADRTRTGYLFGGLAASRHRGLQIAGEVLSGGLSGVAFGPQVEILSRVTQGSQPIGPVRRITESQGHYLIRLDDRPALQCVLEDLALPEDSDDDTLAHSLASTLIGLRRGHDDSLGRPGQFGTETLVRHILGVDPQAQVLAVGDELENGMALAFCARNPGAARADLVRAAEELRREVGERSIRGALYVSCSGRGGSHFGAPSAELLAVREVIGDVPLTGYFAGGEIARDRLYGYTGVLTLFVGTAAG
ncbi:MAG: FIST C-terminal domain-containing protein [Zoogloeaceae bacterium]|nr:FIST C-terminal domain-containing protein [Rhodocyclaceae bacterium]MCP5237728.1 FIST C-terminal domain-containing protein [Zoogloeaceae bacterium]